MIPAGIGETSPIVTLTITSSNRRMLRAMSPATSAAWPAVSRPKASRSGSSTAMAMLTISVGDRERGPGVAAADGSDGVGDEQHALRRDRHVGSQLLDDALRTGHPPASLRDLAAQQQGERRPARALRRPVAPPGSQVIDVGPLPRPDAFLISPDQVRGNSEHLELVGVEAVARVGEQRVRLVPRVAGERVQRGLHGTTVDDAAWASSPGWRSPLQHDFDQSRPGPGAGIEPAWISRSRGFKPGLYGPYAGVLSG